MSLFTNKTVKYAAAEIAVHLILALIAILYTCSLYGPDSFISWITAHRQIILTVSSVLAGFYGVAFIMNRESPSRWFAFGGMVYIFLLSIFILVLSSFGQTKGM
jgi:hypothetical protein